MQKQALAYHISMLIPVISVSIDVYRNTDTCPPLCLSAMIRFTQLCVSYVSASANVTLVVFFQVEPRENLQPGESTFIFMWRNGPVAVTTRAPLTPTCGLTRFRKVGVKMGL